MKEAAGNVDERVELMHSRDECPLEVDHHSDKSVQNGRASLEGVLLNQSQEALIDRLVLPSHQAVEERIRHAISQQSMNNVELSERVNEPCKCPIALNQCGVGEERDGALETKDDDVIAVISEDMVGFPSDCIGQVHSLSSVHFVEEDDVCDGPFVHPRGALLFYLNSAHARMLTGINFDRFNVN